MKILLTLFVLLFSSSVFAEEKDGLFGYKLLLDAFPDKELSYLDLNLDVDSNNYVNIKSKLLENKKYIIEETGFCKKIIPIIPNSDYYIYEVCLTPISNKIYKIRAKGNKISDQLCNTRRIEYEKYFKKTYSNFSNSLLDIPGVSQIESGKTFATFKYIFSPSSSLLPDFSIDFIHIDFICDESTTLEIYAIEHDKSEQYDFITFYKIVGLEEKQLLIDLIDNRLIELESKINKIDKSGL